MLKAGDGLGEALAGILRVKDADSLLSYCGEFISSPAEAYLKEAAQGKNVRQLHELAKMVREASGKIGRMLTLDELAAAVENWQEPALSMKQYRR